MNGWTLIAFLVGFCLGGFLISECIKVNLQVHLDKGAFIFKRTLYVVIDRKEVESCTD